MVKLLLTRPRILVPLSDGESLLLYIAVTMQVVSAALVVEREEEEDRAIKQVVGPIPTPSALSLEPI